MSDEIAVRELDRRWNEAYVRNDRAALAEVLAEDFVGATADGGTVTRQQLMTGGEAAEVSFSEFAIQVFGSTAITRGRIRVTRNGATLEQRFMRVYARLRHRWRAVAVQVCPLAP
jgi:ketosteroid isomerase-like protein